MSKHHRRAKGSRRSRHPVAAVSISELPADYRRASRLATSGQYDEARRLYGELDVATSNTRLRALMENDLATLDAVKGDFGTARQRLEAALAIDETCRPARLNLELLTDRLEAVRGRKGEAQANASRTEPRPPTNTESQASALGAGLMTPPSTGPQVSPAAQVTTEAAALREQCGGTTSIREPNTQALKVVGADLDEPVVGVFRDTREPAIAPVSSVVPIRIAILSFLFNWPSTGGGNIHTVELATFLGRAGYEVRHFCACYPEWGIGRVTDDLPFQSQALEFDTPSWNLDEIKTRYRQAVQSFDPDYVIITDAWNIKPILAEAVEGYPYYLRFQAMECLCPLNNLRLLAHSPEVIEQCPRNQLANPGICRRCLAERGHQSGLLHQRERELCRVGTPGYDRQLRKALEGAEAVLALNPLIASLVEPFAQRVRVVPWGMDSSRFPWPLGGAEKAGRPTVEEEGGVMSPAPSAEGDKDQGGVMSPAPSESASTGGAAVSPFAPRKYALVEGTLSQERDAALGDTLSPERKATLGDVLSPERKTTKGDTLSPERKATLGDVLSPERKATLGAGELSLEIAPVLTLFMAAVQGEFIKGYHVAHEACRLLRHTRSDFELVVTFDPPGRIDEFTRSIGWCSQAGLPRYYRAADVCLVPTIAQDGLSRTSVEAMASGIPVIASRIGGLPFTVNDGVTGLLFEPGNAAELAHQIARLLDDPALRQRMGLAGRQRFEQEFRWETVIDRYYRPLFAQRRVGQDAIHRAEAHR